MSLSKGASSQQQQHQQQQQQQQQQQTKQTPTRHAAPAAAAASSLHPRWHNQSCMLFLALRQHPEHAMPRTDLINTALALDNTISTERDFPLAFRGKVR
jgi:hypothetical protein